MVKSSTRSKQRRGFTLIELVIVVLVVGVLAAIAFPSFMSQVRKARRAEAITELFRASQAQERHRASNTAYSGNLGTGGLRLTSAATTDNYTMANGYYTITVTNTSATRYTLTATASGSMLSDTSCRTLVLDMGDPGPVATPNPPGMIFYRSTTSAPANNTGAANDRCWNR